MKIQSLFLALTICAATVTACQADQKDDQAIYTQISKAVELFEKAFANHDAKSIAALFTPEAEYIDSQGIVFHGRAAIEAEYAAAFTAGIAGKLSTRISSIRPIASGIVVEEGISIYSPESDGPSTSTHYTSLHVQQKDETWLLASVRELTAEELTHHERLKELAWLVGTWREEVEGSSITTQWNWSADGNFLIGEFTVQLPRDRSWKGTHRIGWDAERKQFRSWIFESSGGTAEGAWNSQATDAWVVDLTSINAAGKRSTSTFQYEPDGKDAIVVSSLRLDGLQLNGPSHRIVRTPPVPGTSKTGN